MAFTWFDQNENNNDDGTLNKILKGAYAAALLGNAVADPAGQTQYVIPALESQRQNAEAASLRKRQLDLEERRVQVDEEKLAYATSPAGQKSNMTDYDKKRQETQQVMRAMMSDNRFRPAFDTNNVKMLQTIALDHNIPLSSISDLVDGVKLGTNVLYDKTGDAHVFHTDQNGNYTAGTTIPLGDLSSIEKKVTALNSYRKQIGLLKQGSPAQQRQAVELENSMQMIGVALVGEQAMKASKLLGKDAEEVNTEMLKFHSQGFNQLQDMDRTNLQAATAAAQQGQDYDIYNGKNAIKRQRFLELHEAAWQKMYPGQGHSLLWLMENGPDIGTMGPDEAKSPSIAEQQTTYQNKADAAVSQMGQPNSTTPTTPTAAPSGSAAPPKPLVNLMKERGHDPSNLVWDDKTKRWLLRDTRPGAKVEFYNIQGY
jgi:hypothetical protein